MITGNKVKSILALSLAGVLFFGCSGNNTEDEDTSNYAAEGVIVDPYIEGAVLCEDLNKDGVCGASEQISSASTSEGEFGFSESLTSGSHIIIKEHGMHIGKKYDLNISGVVSSTGTIDVVSPLTTFETKGLTATQIAAILNKAASEALLTGWSISENDIGSNPLSDDLLDKTISNLSAADLVKIQASLASYGILKIMSGSEALSALTPTELYYSGMAQNGHDELHRIAKTLIQGIASVLNTTTLDTITTGISTGRNSIVSGSGGIISQTTAGEGLPEPTVELIIKVAVSIIDRLAEIGYTECNATGGDVSAALSAVSNNQAEITSKAMSLGNQIYGLTYHSQMKTKFSGYYLGALNGIFTAVPDIETGYNAKEDGHSTIRFNSSNNLVAQ